MKIVELYPGYFQKSYTFLYACLGLRKNLTFKPEQTYVRLGKTYGEKDRKLICVYPNDSSNPDWSRFQANTLLSHKMLDTCTETADGKHMVYIFDFNALAEDFDHFLAGRYSQFSANAKKLITDYYMVHTPEWAYMEGFLFPEKAYRTYAELLNVEESILREAIELCDPYNAEKETFTGEMPVEFVELVSIP